MKNFRSKTLGFKIRGQKLTGEAVIAEIPHSLENAKVSVCGKKGFMIDETRVFIRPDGSRENIDCATVAVLEIVDSPVHVHSYTQEIYMILNGSGKMSLGGKVFNVREGNVILIPAKIEHGLLSNNKQPVKVLMTFSPGLVPKTQPDFRDEKIIHEKMSRQIKQMQKK